MLYSKYGIIFKEKRVCFYMKGKVFNIKPKKRKRIKKGHIIFSIIIVYLLVFFTYETFQIISLKKQEQQQSYKLEQLKETKENYQQQLDQVNSPEYIEKIARENLRMIKPGEILYVDSDDEEKADENEQEKETNPNPDG